VVAMIFFLLLFGILAVALQLPLELITVLLVVNFGIVFFIILLIWFETLKINQKRKTTNLKIEELEDDKREISNILELVSDGVFVVDADGKITFFNQAALSILNIIATKKQILGQKIDNLMPTVGDCGTESIIKKVFLTSLQSIRNDFRIVMADKTIKLHTNISPVVSKEGKNEGAIIFFRDITREKRAEEQRAEFTAIASHELRTPLSVIEGYLYYILDPKSKLKYSKETKEYITKAHEAATELNHLVTDILTIVKAEDNELQVSLKEVDLAKLIKDTLKNLQPKAKEKGLDLKFNVSLEKKPPKIKTDPIKVREVLNNLILNAIKFTNIGEIKVELGSLKNELIISVIDTGLGIEKEDLSIIFNKFYRAENYHIRKTSGAGLGLYIVKILVERLGGKVKAQSEFGKGSRFYFTLPIEYPRKEDLSIKPKGARR
jgi:two-component system, OmpR family, phosphate regulon sensor histidine kinase PhoR